ncbi:Gfo/Idh/MocA family oxidoreductase [Arthrobacter sp. Z1-9]
MSEPIRWGIIGTGRISENLVPDLQAVQGAEVTAVWGRTASKANSFAADNGIPFATSDRKELLARDDVDAVYIATPIATHLPIALEALDAGKHVLIEKPMASSAADVDRIFRRAKAVGRFAMEAMWMRFNPMHIELQHRIDAGLLGEPRSVRAGFGMPFPAGGSRWSAELGGSTVLDQGIYPVTFAHRMLGKPAAVSATGVVRDGVDVAAQITLEFPGGRFAHLACSALEFVEPSASVSGTLGWAALDQMFWAVTSASWHAGSVERLFVEPERIGFEKEGNGYRPMLQAVTDAIRSDLIEHPGHGRQSTLEVAQTLDAILIQLMSAPAPAADAGVSTQ